MRGKGHPFVCGELVCWRGADADIPAGSVGEVLCIHEDGDIEVLFFAGTAYEAVYTFGADRLERADASTSDPSKASSSSSSASSSKSKSKGSAGSNDQESAAAAASATTAKRAAQHAQAVAQGVLLGWSVVPLFGPDHALKFPGKSDVGLVLSDTALLDGGNGGGHKAPAGVPRYRYTKEGRTEIKPSKESSAAAAAAAAGSAAAATSEEASMEGVDGATSADSTAGGAAAVAAAAASDVDGNSRSASSKNGGSSSVAAPTTFSHSALVGSAALRRPMTVGVSALGPGGGAALSTTLVFGVTADARQVSIYSLMRSSDHFVSSLSCKSLKSLTLDLDLCVM